MVITECTIIDGIEYSHTYSDLGLKIERDGIQYDDAYDPAFSGRIYTETDIPIENDEISDAEALKIITEGVI